MQGIFREMFILALLFSAVFRLPIHVQDFFYFFLPRKKAFTSVPQEMRLISWTFNFKKLRQSFVDARAMITIALTSSCHWKTLVFFCLRKKRPGKAFLTLTVNYCKIIQKNKLCHSKQQQISYLMMYDVIQSFVVLVKKLAFFNKQL